MTLEDNAEYECQAANNKLRSPVARVTVQAPPDNPVIDNGFAAIREVIENREVALTCVSGGSRPAAEMSWFDQDGELINGASYKSELVEDVMGVASFRVSSTVRVTPTKRLHNASYRCETWNVAGKARPASVRFDVRYSPSVTVTMVRPVGGMAREGEKVGFRCKAEANPPPFADKYRWFVDDRPVAGQYGFYYELPDVTRDEHRRQVKCVVENELGVASGVKSIEVTCEYTIKIYTQSLSF